ncbi:GNAT family N-acetyltransferase [Pectobacterium aroidearum]|jgi:putative acetyltransferase|uniref:GNAT family N-acetyltransferase n=1 Tax=Pectobacterium aroidearum TaxID=1201031 RepID=A0ABR5ZFP3_9GAMM|nr:MULTISPECIES: GNAT family N-acetyltransferase [Pectobacterium]MBA5200602.1 GNAT family N-acetyltransferase [Pectobacterium aroidearum]MBA5228984.1 GNAT family N-acetyltransferase [Pectobacterium aroidearum]MBA5233394.1 GNAT family N-acetyltransferase [Pectobacterium aroidearum]MBA5601902.1 GNAT family N-acetyltransferase [Pectobacterium aroidearum]MBA5738594.1 GNAT family N-acetyltransferase [Pectobacterium aroidearum]
MTTATSAKLQVRPITAQDDAAIARVIRQVSAEFGLTADKGYTVSDPNLDALFALYSQPQSAYWVIEYEGCVVGGGGIAPLVAGDEDVCELQKMYFLPIARGKGLARQLAIQALDFARQHGFRRCYLETTGHLTSAIRLYESLGFEPIPHSMGNTGHTDCEVTMLKVL